MDTMEVNMEFHLIAYIFIAPWIDSCNRILSTQRHIEIRV